MREWDIFKPPPAEYIGTFDVVHIRHVQLVIKDNDPAPIVKNLRALLKPNGYLQWDEVNPPAKYLEKVDTSLATPALETLFMKFTVPKKDQVTKDWKDTLLTTLNAHGFKNSELITYKPSLSHLKFWHDMYMQAWEEFIGRIMGGLDTPNAIELLEGARIEAKSGAAIVFPMCIWVAQAV
ncbi:MAG: hypothetical protein LQ343_006004 [Gyalolechia ehrenbergii]|nr:MAG: hypothetical protein LQ343_006004 [Gyalolechia ehrenbergii]